MNIDNKHELQPTIGGEIPGPVRDRFAQVQGAVLRLEHLLSPLEKAFIQGSKVTHSGVDFAFKIATKEQVEVKGQKDRSEAKVYNQSNVINPDIELGTTKVDNQFSSLELSVDEKNHATDEARARKLVDEALRGYADAA